MFAKALNAIRILRVQGFGELVRVARKNFVRGRWAYLNRRFDTRHGVDTAGSIEPNFLQIDSQDRQYGVRYEPTAVKTFHRMLAQIPADLSSYTFVDYGSGKGRVLLLASHYPFKKIIGVEYAKDLHEIAQRNIQSYRAERRRCQDIQSVHGDAASFPIPDGPVIYYFFQPFILNVMQAVIDNIRESFMADPREMYLILFHPHPTAISIIERATFLRRMPTSPLGVDYELLYPRDLAIYKA